MSRKRGKPLSAVFILDGGAALAAAWILAGARRSPGPDLVCSGRPLSAWASALKFRDTQEQAEKVIQAAGSNAVPSLVRLLRTPDSVLAGPIKAIGRHTPERFSRVLYRLANPFAASEKRVAAVRALRILGPDAQSALPALTNALRDEETISWNAALALAELGEPGIQALIQALPSSAPVQAGAICYALGTQGPSASNAIPVLASVMETGPAQVADRAASALGEIGRQAVPRLAQSLGCPDAAVRVQAVRALAMIGPAAREALPRLIQMASEDEIIVRQAVIDALPRIRPTGAGVRDVLTNALHGPDAQLRAKAADALHRIHAVE